MQKRRRFDLFSTKPRNFLGLIVLVIALPVAIIFNIVLGTLMLLDPRSWKFNKTEALSILDREMSRFSDISYDECIRDVEGNPVVSKNITGESGVEYQVEIEMIWDHLRNGPIRIIGGIDDGRLRAYKPLTRSIIIKSPVVEVDAV